MKRRRARGWNSSGIQKSSTGGLRRGGNSLETRVYSADDSIKSVNRKEAPIFSSLESLFDVKKPFDLPEIVFSRIGEGHVEGKNTVESSNLTKLELQSAPSLEKLQLKASDNTKLEEPSEMAEAENDNEEQQEMEGGEDDEENVELIELMVEDEEFVEGGDDAQESFVGSLPSIDSELVAEMSKADERCTVIAQEIEQLKAEITELMNKKDLTEEDTEELRVKQESVMAKLAEFEEMTRNIQRALGTISDTSAIEKVPATTATDQEEIEVQLEEEAFDQGDVGLKDKDRFDLLARVEYPEDKLPRVIVCGCTEDQIPKIVVADSERKGRKRCLQNLTGRLTESLTMQEKLVHENAQLEGGRYKLEQALLEKDSALESLQRKVCGLQAEMRIVVKENAELNRQISNLNQRVSPSSPAPLRPCSYTSSFPCEDDEEEEDYPRCKCCARPHYATISDSPRLAGGASRTTARCSSRNDDMSSPVSLEKSQCPGGASWPRGTCPAELESKLANYGNSTKQLEQQLGSMECEVRNMQIELANVQRERQQLEQQRKLLECTGPCAPCACTQSSGPGPSAPMPKVYGSVKEPSVPVGPNGPPMCAGSCVNAPMGASTCPQQQLRDLREQYARLQDDYKNKLCEVSFLRTDADKLKQQTRDAIEDKDKMEIRMIDAQERLKSLEANKDKYEGFKEQMVEQEQALLVAKQRFRESQDELEELRSLIQDQATQLEDYRNKYLQAQQQVEEQRRQLDLMEMDNARMNENVTLEIGRVKNQFQEKLAELAPLPDILKQTQVKLQEAQQLRLVAERNCEDLSRELIGCKDKIQNLQNQLDVLRAEHQALQDESGHGSGRFEELEKKNGELRHENERMKNTLARFQEHEADMQKRIDEKMHEITQLTAIIEQVREDSARQVARTKERCDALRKTMQSQIAEMERQLAQCRAAARTAQKERDEIRQKMQGQINNLNEAFDQAQGRIRSLQGHVNYLKTSYSNIFKGQGEVPPGVMPGDGAPGFDSCDCNY